MKTLVVGGSGATGRKLVTQLLNRGQKVKVIVRSPERLPETWKQYENLTIVQGSVLHLSDIEMRKHVDGCKAVISCLGHNMTWKGIYGQPRLLVRDSVRRLTKAIKLTQPEQPVKFILMNTTGNRNRDINEKITAVQQFVITLIRLMLPPHVDNEKAADYLRTQVGQNDPHIEWVAVRPDSLIEDKAVSDYMLYPSPIKSALFDSGKTSRINVAHFISRLISEKGLWQNWVGQMPVIYNTTSIN